MCRDCETRGQGTSREPGNPWGISLDSYCSICGHLMSSHDPVCKELDSAGDECDCDGVVSL